MQGYDDRFLGKAYFVGMPDYEKYFSDIAMNKITSGHVLDYIIIASFKVKVDEFRLSAQAIFLE